MFSLVSRANEVSEERELARGGGLVRGQQRGVERLDGGGAADGALAALDVGRGFVDVEFDGAEFR